MYMYSVINVRYIRTNIHVHVYLFKTANSIITQTLFPYRNPEYQCIYPVLETAQDIYQDRIVSIYNY